MQTARRISLIIAVLLLLIFVPTQIAGLSDLASAGSAATAHDKSHYYESAAQRLTWRSDLYVAEEMFVCGTAAEVSAVNSVDDRAIPCPGPMTTVIAAEYAKAVRGEIDKFKDWCELV